MIQYGTHLNISHHFQKRILLQSDGPYNNVLKFKSPLVFNEDNAKTLLKELDIIFADISDVE